MKLFPMNACGLPIRQLEGGADIGTCTFFATCIHTYFLIVTLKEAHAPIKFKPKISKFEQKSYATPRISLHAQTKIGCS